MTAVSAAHASAAAAVRGCHVRPAAVLAVPGALGGPTAARGHRTALSSQAGLQQ